MTGVRTSPSGFLDDWCATYAYQKKQQDFFRRNKSTQPRASKSCQTSKTSCLCPLKRRPKIFSWVFFLLFSPSVDGQERRVGNSTGCHSAVPPGETPPILEEQRHLPCRPINACTYCSPPSCFSWLLRIPVILAQVSR